MGAPERLAHVDSIVIANQPLRRNPSPPIVEAAHRVGTQIFTQSLGSEDRTLPPLTPPDVIIADNDTQSDETATTEPASQEGNRMEMLRGMSLPIETIENPVLNRNNTHA